VLAVWLAQCNHAQNIYPYFGLPVPLTKKKTFGLLVVGDDTNIYGRGSGAIETKIAESSVRFFLKNMKL
jgi:hypothetical protein